MAQPAPAPASVPSGEPWQSPIAESNKAPALEPIDLPPAIEQGVDMIYIDEALVPRAALFATTGAALLLLAALTLPLSFQRPASPVRAVRTQPAPLMRTTGVVASMSTWKSPNGGAILTTSPVLTRSCSRFET